jgi:hypothetical protein
MNAKADDGTCENARLCWIVYQLTWCMVPSHLVLDLMDGEVAGYLKEYCCLADSKFSH